jgi:hypothetical protein
MLLLGMGVVGVHWLAGVPLLLLLLLLIQWVDFAVERLLLLLLLRILADARLKSHKNFISDS